MKELKICKISDFLEERIDRFSPEEANRLNLPRVHKIDFGGNIHLRQDKPTQTAMIRVSDGDLIISGINVSKGAVAIYHGKSDAAATIHYSSYKFDSTQIFMPYFSWFLRSPVFRKAISEQVKGGIKTEIKPKTFLPLKIKIHSSIEEQVRIAEKIKSAVGNVTQLQKIRNENLLLLEKLQQSVFDDAYSEAEEKTKLVDLIDLIQEKPRNGYSPKPVEYKTKCLSLTLSATTSGFFNGSYSKFIDEEISQDSHLWLENGDILIQRGNTLDYVGVSAVYNGGSKTFIYPDLMMKIRPKETVLSEYLHCMLMSEQVRSYFRSNASGTSGSMPKINQKVVMNTKIPFLDESSQKTLVRVVHERLKTAKKLKENINNDFSDTDAFVDSILNEAFKTVT